MAETPMHFSRKKADAYSNGIFLISLGILFLTDTWWPGILVAIWATMAIRQILTERYYDFAISSIVLLGFFAITFFSVKWSILLPVLFVLGGIFIIFREYFAPEEEDIVLEEAEELEEEERKDGK